MKWLHRLKKLNILDRTAICEKCGPVKVRAKGKGKWGCKNARGDSPERWRKRRCKRKYGITQDRVEELKQEQNQRCLICKKKEKLVIDHNHKTGHVRGLLCGHCNSMLGFARDNAEILISGAKYLQDSL